jgi:hypothetical protein
MYTHVSKHKNNKIKGEKKKKEEDPSLPPAFRRHSSHPVD